METHYRLPHDYLPPYVDALCAAAAIRRYSRHAAIQMMFLYAIITLISLWILRFIYVAVTVTTPLFLMLTPFFHRRQRSFFYFAAAFATRSAPAAC